MGVRWMVNAGLLALPIGSTLGVLFGIDSQRQSAGQAPLFGGGNGNNNGNSTDGGSGGSGGGGGGGGGTVPVDNGITVAQYCDREVGIKPATKGSQYTFNPNQWGWEEGDPGALCIKITEFHNQTYETKTTAPEFSVTWQYPTGPEDAPVHAFPYIQVDAVQSIAIKSLEHVNLAVEWTYGVGSQPAASTDVDALAAVELNANVAIDMFLDSNKTAAQNSTVAKYEVMVWFAHLGAATQPLGTIQQGIVQTINGTEFVLWAGENSLQQTVLTWVASETTEAFTGDVAPLLTQLPSIGNANFPNDSDFLGYMSIGSETFSSSSNVTFSIPVLSVDVLT